MASDPIRDAMERPEFWMSEAAIPYRPREAPEPVYGGARSASARDLAAFLNEPDDPCVELPHVAPLVRTGKGGELRLLPKERLYFSRDFVCRNILAVGQVASGKTQGFILPLVFGTLHARPDATLVVLDTKGDLFDILSRWADQNRPELDLRCLNFTDPKRSEGYNPHDPTNESDPFSVAHTIVHATTNAEDGRHPFWPQCSTRIATALHFCNLKSFGDSFAVFAFARFYGGL